MLKLLVVDDEPFFLDFIRNFLEEPEYGCEIVGVASDGLKAMNILQTSSVDVIFTDIKMPVMDGLELICNGMEYNSDYQFVVLSSYSDFHMVGQAFKLGAKEYLLKSEFTSEQVLEILEKCGARRVEINENRGKVKLQKQLFLDLCQEITSLQTILDSNKNEWRKSFFSTILSRKSSFSEAAEHPHARHFLPQGRVSRVLLVQIADYHRILRDGWNDDHMLFEFAMNNIFDEICQKYPNTTFFCHSHGEFLVLFLGDGEAMLLNHSVFKLFEALRNSFRACLLIDGIFSSVFSSFPPETTLLEMYEETKAISVGFFLLGRNRLLTEVSLMQQQATAFHGRDLEEIIGNFSALLITKNIQHLQDTLSEYLIFPEQAAFSQIRLIRSLYLRYSFYLKEYSITNNSLERMEERLGEYEEYLKFYGTLEELNHWLQKAVTTLLQMEYNLSGLIKRTQKYILANYTKEITLAEIADAMRVNPNYLSRTFSKEHGSSLISYVNEVRIQAASNLLKHTNLKNYEIAEKVGYKNVEHFSRIFKKNTGKTPGEYREDA